MEPYSANNGTSEMGASVSVEPPCPLPTGPVSERVLQDEHSMPLAIHATKPGVRLSEWAEKNGQYIGARLTKHGALLFRGFDVKSAREFEDFIRTISGEPLEYRERSSPRSRVTGKIYTSTDHPPTQSIFVHNENSYRNTFNLKIFFFCDTPASHGGETPIADCRRVLRSIPEAVRKRFEEKKWMYVRNYGDGFGLPWEEVFLTKDRRVVEEHCRENGIEVEWKGGNRLRTSAILPALVRHPQTGEPVWFNHATFFNVSTLEPWVHEALLEEFDSPHNLPTNTFYGDGSPIQPEVLNELRRIYSQETVSFPWMKSDVLLLDNILVAHGRMPYQGKRRILVGMAEPFTRDAESRQAVENR